MNTSIDRKVIPIKPQYYDNTMLGDYKKCPRMYYLRHERGWRPQGTAMALIFGLAWHEALDVLYRGWHRVKDGSVNVRDLIEVCMDAFEATWIDEGLKPFSELSLQDIEMLGPRTPATAEEMLHGYVEKRRHVLDNMELIRAEAPFAVPIFPDRNDVWYIGRRDKDIKLNGDILILEHKTTTEYKVDGGFKTQYLEAWNPNSQCQGYLYSANMEHEGKVRYVWVDAALVHKKVHDAFRFIPISATFDGLDNWLWEARDWIGRIESEKERLEGQPKNRQVMGAFPKNTEQCSGKYGLCGFLSICRGYNNPDSLQEPPAGYINDPWHPFEILRIAELGLPDDKPEERA